MKDIIKGLPGARYDPPSKEWILPMELKQKMLCEINDICEENAIKIFDYPEFATLLANNTIPFKGSNKNKKIGSRFRYEDEVKIKIDTDSLPEKMKQALY